MFKWKKLLIPVIVLMVAIASVVFYRNYGFRIRSVSPSTDKIGSLTPYVDITFNKDLDARATQVKSDPSWVVTGKQINKNVLRIFFQKPLTVGLNFSFNVNAKIANGDKIINKSYVVSVKNIAFDDLPKSQQTYLTQSQNQGAFKDPLLAYLPHTTPEFKLSGSIDNSGHSPKLDVSATLYLNQADLSNQAVAEARYKQSVLDYIRSVGLNPDDYQITFTNSLP